MDLEARQRIGVRIALARRESGLTQRELADRLGVTARSIQNYESGAVVPHRHLGRIETLADKPRGWILNGREEETAAVLATLQQLAESIEDQHSLVLEELAKLRVQLEGAQAGRDTGGRAVGR